MAVPKLPLIVPKKALSPTPALVPKISPKITPALMSKGPGLTKALHTKANLPPIKPTEDNSDSKPPEKYTRLVSYAKLNSKKMNSVDVTEKVVDSSQSQLLNEQPPNQDEKPLSTKSSMTNSRRNSFHEDLASRMNRSSILSDLSVGHSTKSISKTFSDEESQPSPPNLSKAPSKDLNSFIEQKSSNFTKSEDNHDQQNQDERDDVGYTPWLKIEKRINQIRSLGSKDLNYKPTHNKPKDIPNLYNNYKTDYEENGWKKETTHPLTYGMVQKLNDKRQFELPKDNWKFINGFIKPRRKPFSSMSEMSKYFQKVDTKDQYELIKLLLACRDLEKVIEEQHTVLDMLDHDLREARDLFPDSLNNVTTQRLFGSSPEDEPFYPSSEVPLFIKGRVFLLPKNGKNTPKGNK